MLLIPQICEKIHDIVRVDKVYTMIRWLKTINAVNSMVLDWCAFERLSQFPSLALGTN